MLRYTYHPDGSVETMTNSRVGYCPMGMTIGGRLISVADRTGEIVGYCHTPRRKGKGDLSPEPAYENDRDGNLHMLTETKDGEETSYLYDLCGNCLEKGKGGGQRDTVTMGKISWSDGRRAEMPGTIPMTSRATWSGKLRQRGSGSIFMIPKTVRSVSFPEGRRSRRNGMTGKGCVSA